MWWWLTVARSVAVVNLVALRLFDERPADTREVDIEPVQTALRSRTRGVVESASPSLTTCLHGPDHQHRTTVTSSVRRRTSAGQHTPSAAPNRHPHTRRTRRPTAGPVQVRQNGSTDVDAYPAAWPSSDGHWRQDPAPGWSSWPVSTASLSTAVHVFRPRNQSHHYRLVAGADNRVGEVMPDDVSGFVEPQMCRRHVYVGSDAVQRESIAVIAGSLHAPVHCKQSQRRI